MTYTIHLICVILKKRTLIKTWPFLNKEYSSNALGLCASAAVIVRLALTESEKGRE